MEPLVMIVLVGALQVAFGQNQCGAQQKCVPIGECPEFKSDVYKSEQIEKLQCGSSEQGNPEKIRVCCMDRGVLNIKKCGKQSKDRIAHGEIAEVFDYSWMALLGDINKNFHCGGSLIAESFVLTAAHCNRNKVTFVRVGETVISTTIDCNIIEDEEECAEPHQDIPVARFMRHPNYSSSKGTNDIALIKLEHPAQISFNHSVHPICLPFPENVLPKLPHKMIISGWGYTETQNKISDQLREASVSLIELDQCKKILNEIAPRYPRSVDNSKVCAGGDGSLTDHCAGDSGGPLQYYGRKGMVIHGVVAWGLSSCGTKSLPGVYTKVAHYLDWIVTEANNVSETLTEVTTSTGKPVPATSNVTKTLVDDLDGISANVSTSNNGSETSTEVTTSTADENPVSETNNEASTTEKDVQSTSVSSTTIETVDTEPVPKTINNVPIVYLVFGTLFVLLLLLLLVIVVLFSRRTSNEAFV